MIKPSLCLNMIVKNEAARIERCLNSVLPYVKSVAFLDTGSTDNTADLIADLCDAAGVPCVGKYGEFRDFSFARNHAFDLARTHNGRDLPFCQFALLVDADMELVVDDARAAFNDLDATAMSYDMMQKGGAVSYANRRLVNLNWTSPPYVGVTHEYIDVPAAGMITGAVFLDHADGANRPDKFARDAALLEDALKTEPNNGRYLYYLGNTYRDWDRPANAIKTYDKRIALGGWDEETHSAMMNRACCYRDIKMPQMFVSGMLDAYNFRPSRAEPLYDLAKHYREKGENAAALVFAKAGVNLKRPNDLLFVNDFVYDYGLRYEYSVVGYYNEKERNGAFQVTDDLALDPACPPPERWSARSNLYWHTKPLATYCPSFVDKQIDFTSPDGYIAMNPSIEQYAGHITCNIRCVNYKIDEQGRYMIGPKECGDAPIDTRNFVCKMDDDYSVNVVREVIWDRPLAKFPLVTGLEDVRLYRVNGALHFSACVREQASNGACQQMRGRLVHDHDDQFMIVTDCLMMSNEDATEKNWMPMPHDGKHDFVYRLDTIVHRTDPEDPRLATVCSTGVYINDISGSSQLIQFKAGWLSVVHEAVTGPDGKRSYWHRFAWFERDGRLRRLSLPFVFLDRQIEFCAGLAYHPDRRHLMISFGVRDAEAHIATVEIEEVARMIWKFHEN